MMTALRNILLINTNRINPQYPGSICIPQFVKCEMQIGRYVHAPSVDGDGEGAGGGAPDVGEGFVGGVVL